MNETDGISPKKRSAGSIFLKVFIPVVFLITGLSLLALRIPGWSLILGLPTTIFGITFLIYAYDEVVSGSAFRLDDEREVAHCSICGRPTIRAAGQAPEDVICSDCKKKIARGVEKKS